MKIGILGTRGIPNNYGGFEQFAQCLSKGLVARGHDVTVYNSSNHPYKDKTWNGVHIIHCSDRGKKIGTAGQFLYDLWCNKDARNRNFDVLLHFGYSSDAVWWKLWPRNTVNIVNMDGLEWRRTKYNALTRKFLKASEKWAALHADALIADSPGIRDHLMDNYGVNASVISYGAEVFIDKYAGRLEKYSLAADGYFLVIARMEPENNIEMIINGWLASNKEKPLVIVGAVTNRHGRKLVEKYDNSSIRFLGSIYDQDLLNNLRAFSAIYFHGHTVGGTNPSLLEAMACGCNIVAHENIFNKHVLGNAARYFYSIEQVADSINEVPEASKIEENIKKNIQKIQLEYNPEKIINTYEQLIIHSRKKLIGNAD